MDQALSEGADLELEHPTPEKVEQALPELLLDEEIHFTVRVRKAPTYLKKYVLAGAR